MINRSWFWTIECIW